MPSGASTSNYGDGSRLTHLRQPHHATLVRTTNGSTLADMTVLDVNLLADRPLRTAPSSGAAPNNTVHEVRPV